MRILERMFLPHGNDGFPQCLPAQVGAKPGVALVGDVGVGVAWVVPCCAYSPLGMASC